MLLEGLIGVSAGLAGALVGRGWHRGGAAPRIERRIASLCGLVEELQRTHDHHAGELDRRLLSVEQAMARTENETRMLAGQLVGDRGLVGRVERLERRVLAHDAGAPRSAS
jgi:hypothetical protein